MTLDEVKDLLTPASVWLRRDGAQVKALFLTNQSLTKAQREKYPSQVVYADADGNILSRDLESFASFYTFLNVDPDLEKRLSNLIVFKATDFLTVDDPEDDEVSIEEPAEEKPAVKEKPAVQVREKLKPVEEKESVEVQASGRALIVDFKFSASEGYANPQLTAKDLTEACKIYTRQPDENYKMVVHRLSFELSDKITIDALKEAFHPSQTVNTVDAFRVRAGKEKEIFVWDSWIGVFPEYSISSLYATVYVGTSTLSPVDTEETPGTETVDVAVSPLASAAVDAVQAIAATKQLSDLIGVVQETPAVVSFNAHGGTGPVTLTADDLVPRAVANPDVPPLQSVQEEVAPAAPVVTATPAPTVTPIVTPVVQVQVQPQVQVQTQS